MKKYYIMAGKIARKRKSFKRGVSLGYNKRGRTNRRKKHVGPDLACQERDKEKE
jgi:hypothetical protein